MNAFHARANYTCSLRRKHGQFDVYMLTACVCFCLPVKRVDDTNSQTLIMLSLYNVSIVAGPVLVLLLGGNSSSSSSSSSSYYYYYYYYYY